MKRRTVKSIVHAWLKANGFSGLRCSYCQCCGKHLFWCVYSTTSTRYPSECRPGYLRSDGVVVATQAQAARGRKRGAV